MAFHARSSRIFTTMAAAGLLCFVMLSAGCSDKAQKQQPPQTSTAPASGPATAPSSQPAKELTLDLGNKVTMKLVLIHAGEFMMGSLATEKGRQENEGPQHKIAIVNPFYMGVYEVTQEQYEIVMVKNPSYFIRAQNPVETVSWEDAVEFCKKLSQKTGNTVRLPTEAEWEYACRSGSTTRFYYGDDNDYSMLDNYAWHGGNSDCKTHTVGQKKPNDWGLYDMHGNLSEWCSGRYADDAQGGNSIGYPSLESYPERGGSWGYPPGFCRSAYRKGVISGDKSYYVGFRVVVEKQ